VANAYIYSYLSILPSYGSYLFTDDRQVGRTNCT